jgi:hypothetical protein
MGPISEQKEEPLLKKTELLLTIVRIVTRGELSFEIATSPPTLNVAKPPLLLML